jgi:hypothetical protein
MKYVVLVIIFMISVGTLAQADSGGLGSFLGKAGDLFIEIAPKTKDLVVKLINQKKYKTGGNKGRFSLTPKNKKSGGATVDGEGYQTGDNYRAKVISIVQRTEAYTDLPQYTDFKRNCPNSKNVLGFRTVIIDNRDAREGTTVCVEAVCPPTRKDTDNSVKRITSSCQSVGPEYCRSVGNHFYSHIKGAGSVSSVDGLAGLPSNSGFLSQSFSKVVLDKPGASEKIISDQDGRVDYSSNTVNRFFDGLLDVATTALGKERQRQIKNKTYDQKISNFSYPWVVEHCLLLYNSEFTASLSADGTGRSSGETGSESL